MKSQRRKILMLAALVTVGLVIWTAWRDVSNQSTATVVAVRPRTGIYANRTASANQLLAKASGEWARDPLVESSTDPFKVVSFLPPPPPPVAPPPPPKPVAPPFPYRYFGRMVGIDGKLVTYLTRDDTLIPIHEKEILDNVYRIDTLSDQQLVVTYLPLDEKTVISLKSVAE